jgi:hypothetical protein
MYIKSEVRHCARLLSLVLMRDASPRQLERLFQLDELIRSGKAQTMGQLATALEVSDRTVHSDLIFLRDRYEAPIKNNRSQGYYRVTTMKTPPGDCPRFRSPQESSLR